MTANKVIRAALSLLFFLVGLAFLAACYPLVLWLGTNVGSANAQAAQAKSTAELVPAYNMYVNNLASTALDGLLAVPKVYWLAEDIIVGPKPNPDCFGSSYDPADAAEVLAEAKKTLDLDETLWSPDRSLQPGSAVHWYLDDTIFSVTWKEVHNYCSFSFSEIKIAHPSQFKRYFADNTFSSPIQYPPTDMAYSVNAVTALSGDFYKNRTFGTVVYQRQLYRMEGQYLDVCYVDAKGDLNFVHRGELATEEETLRYVEDNDILFSLCFGPILIENDQVVVPDNYLIGEINDIYARCGICQLGECHYLLVTSNSEAPYGNYLTVRDFAEVLHSLGIQKAYTLDGGQTAAMYADGQLINAVEFGHQRNVSDIIYFVTAYPEQ